VRAERIEDLFAVYHDGFRLRMAEFLAHDFPVLREAVGDEVFGAMAEAYMGAHPSRFRNARWFSAKLPEFLRETQPFAEDRFGCGIAALEGALARAFDAADAEPLAISALAETPRENWPNLRFSFHPSVALVDAPAASLAAFGAIQMEEEIDLAAIEDKDFEILVWRRELDTQYRPLDEWEALALNEALLGARFGDICSMLAFARPEEPAEELTAAAAGFLVAWFGEGLIVSTTTEVRKGKP
jgi:hypothetical protein